MSNLLFLQLTIWTVSPALTTETPSPSSLPVSCREVVYSRATNPIDCARVPRSVLGFKEDLDLDDEWETPFKVAGPPQPGAVYDTAEDVGGQPDQPIGRELPVIPHHLTLINPSILKNFRAVVGKLKCNDLIPQLAQRAYLCVRAGGMCTDVMKPSYACLNNAERFYYLLKKLLQKIGKNDFAIKIK